VGEVCYLRLHLGFGGIFIANTIFTAEPGIERILKISQPLRLEGKDYCNTLSIQNGRLPVLAPPYILLHSISNLAVSSYWWCGVR